MERIYHGAAVTTGFVADLSLQPMSFQASDTGSLDFTFLGEEAGFVTDRVDVALPLDIQMPVALSLMRITDVLVASGTIVLSSDPGDPTTVALLATGDGTEWGGLGWYDGPEVVALQGGEHMIVREASVTVEGQYQGALGAGGLEVVRGQLIVTSSGALEVFDDVTLDADSAVSINGRLVADELDAWGRISGDGAISARRVVIRGELAPGGDLLAPPPGERIALPRNPAANPTDVPEPATWTVLFAALIGMAGARRFAQLLPTPTLWSRG